ncbi:hypothetical protein RHMOL_Rhmol05G0233100 [Rhododendron molle]|uniref:Uncharacterized protein n=1 Tax=Rhododendron molle TaxID=49168 RepID=A0ACC0NTQ9_RHOML|nr:hypothetical protein RHMOL_Rhmol05G0233100 [Rhododendron molle]
MAAESSSTTCREPKKTKQASPITLLADDSPPLPDLPPEIIAAVLSRLPVKSLLRLRCVCKSWRSLISNPKFVKTHLSLASANTDYSNHRLILNSSYPCTDVKSCSLSSILNEKSDSAVQLDCPFKGPNFGVKIWGCCDGLVCIGTGREVCIWNPSTGKYKGLPDFVEMSYICYSWFGFGYDEGIDDYKVVGFFFGDHGSGFETKVKVYALRSDSWRRIEGYTHGIPEEASGTFLNRALHWIHWPGYATSNDIIVSLDLVKETYGEFSAPEYRHGYFHLLTLGVLNGCLCMLCNYYDDCFEVWVMKEYGMRDSWTKLVVIPYVSHPLNHPHDSTELYILENGEVLEDIGSPYNGTPYSAPLCLLENGEVLLVATTHLDRYNPKDGTFSYPVIHNCSPCFTAYPYIESLVSPDFDADSGVQW